MKRDKQKQSKGRLPSPPPAPAPARAVAAAAVPAPVLQRRPLFRKIDWWCCGLTALLVFIGYMLTLAPNQTLEDSGELATASMYLGVPHPPGYPVWTVYSWVFTKILPIHNIAWRVGVSSAFASALACGLIGLMVSRGSSMMLEGIEGLKNLDRRLEDAVCLVAGYVAGMLMGFNGFMWSQAVIVEVYTLSVLSLAGTMVLLLRWLYAPEQRRYLYWAMFIFGICFTNHQTLIVAAVGIPVLVAMAQPKLGRDVFLACSLMFVAGLLAKAAGRVAHFDNNPPMFVIFILVGILFVVGFVFLAGLTLRRGEDWAKFVEGWLFLFGMAYLGALIVACAGIPPLSELSRGGHALFNLVGLGVLGLFIYVTVLSRKPAELARLPEWSTAVFALAAVYLATLIGTATGLTARLFSANLAAFTVHHLIGLTLLFFAGRAISRVQHFGETAIPTGLMGLTWAGGVSFYLLMPIFSMTNPPLNWGYPRTVEGFFHALTRGQYEKANPANILEDPLRFIGQIWYYIEGAIEEFNLVYLLLALVPFFFLRRMQKRERAWMIGLTVIYIGLALLLLILLNPQPDRQSKELNRVFFTASHVMLAMWIGYGITLLTVLLLTQYERVRIYFALGAGAAVGVALYSMAGLQRVYWLDQFTAGFGLALAVAAAAVFLLWRHRLQFTALLTLFVLMPVYAISSHWWDNEQRGHLFGYWFGHDMFTPPFVGPDGKLSYDARLREEAMKGPDGVLVYPEMDRHTVLFGGTDPGRFNPTYMIFCESFIPRRCKQPENPEFDRRDVYLITQNALADGTYLNYIRAQYNRSAQQDPPFFQHLFNSRLFAPLDNYFTNKGAEIEASRRARGVYPPKEILTPNAEDSHRAFQEYLQDATRRRERGQLKPGEIVDVQGGRVQVSGQVAVMAINGLLTKIIFDKNPEHEFYVEESFPLDWMYPHLTPSGIIMKINRQEVPELTEEIVRRDHHFWRSYMVRTIGDWIDYDTPVKDIVDFAEKVYLRRDLRDFQGSRKFLRDDNAQKAFSKLRSAIGGVYTWRINHIGGQLQQKQEEQRRAAADPAESLRLRNEIGRLVAERDRMIREADFAYRQAFAMCPYSPEAVFRYATLLLGIGRREDAVLIATTCQKMDPDNPAIRSLVDQIRGAQPAPPPQITPSAIPEDFTNAFQLVSALLGQQQTGQAIAVLDQILNNPRADQVVVLSVAQAFLQLQQIPRLEHAMRRMTELSPASPEAWYDLAAVQAVLDKADDAIKSLTQAMAANTARLAVQPDARNLVTNARTDTRLNRIRSHPEFQKLVPPAENPAPPPAPGPAPVPPPNP